MKKYDYVDKFHEGFAVVRLNKKYGFINKEDKEVVKCKYDYLYNFDEGLAKAELNGKLGYINIKGEEVFQ